MFKKILSLAVLVLSSSPAYSYDYCSGLQAHLESVEDLNTLIDQAKENKGKELESLYHDVLKDEKTDSFSIVELSNALLKIENLHSDATLVSVCESLAVEIEDSNDPEDFTPNLRPRNNHFSIEKLKTALKMNFLKETYKKSPLELLDTEELFYHSRWVFSGFTILIKTFSTPDNFVTTGYSFWDEPIFYVFSDEKTKELLKSSEIGESHKSFKVEYQKPAVIEL